MYKHTHSIKNLLDTISKEEIIEGNKKEQEKAKKEYSEFVKYYQKGECYICKKSLKTFSSKNNCLHYLLRNNNKIKKKFFSEIFKKWGYFNISTYLRRIANQERPIGNINNLESEKEKKKKFEYTIKRKNREWTFSCTNNDFIGHKGNCNFPHYHFQMKIDGVYLIKFKDFHISFTDEDLFNFEFIKQENVVHGWGIGGDGIQEALDKLEKSPNKGIEKLKRTDNEEEAQFKIDTIITGEIDGDKLNEIISESKKTGKTTASLLQKELPENNKIQTIITPINNIPDISNRKGGRSNKK